MSELLDDNKVCEGPAAFEADNHHRKGYVCQRYWSLVWARRAQ